MTNLIPTLLISDSVKLVQILSDVLNEYSLTCADSSRLGIAHAKINIFELVIIDLKNTSITSLNLCLSLRNIGVTCPVVVLGSDQNVMTKIKLLDSGASDYMTKPFSVGELKAKLRSLLRQASLAPKETLSPLIIEDLELDRQNLVVKREGTAINLRRKEFMLLECLMERAGSAVSRLTLLRSAWPQAEDVWTNALDVHINHLRRKLDRPFNKPLIETVYGVGYRLVDLSVQNYK